MAENEENTNDIKKPEFQDLEMGDSTPKINHYMNDVKKPEVAETKAPEEPAKPEVNPAAAAPEPAPEPQTPTTPAIQPTITPTDGKTIGQMVTGTNTPATPAPAATPTPTPAATQTATQSPHKPVVKKPVGNPAARKKAILGCFGGFASVLLIFLVFAFIFIAQSDADASPIAKLLGINQASFVNGLITLVHIIFTIIALGAFVFTVVGLFKAGMAKKDDKESKKSALKTSLFAGITLVIILIAWMFVFLYLDAKRVHIGPNVKDPIITTPEETINLSAPIEIKFDGSNVPVDRTKYQIVYSEWDFGDGGDATGQIVTHKYETKGVFDVILTITLREKKSGEEVQAQYSTNVTIVNQALTASFSADPQSGEAPLEVKFDASNSVDPDGTIAKYEWDLDGDGDYDDGEGKTAEYEYEKVGKYTAALRVTSTTDESDVSEKEIVVEESMDPEPVISIVDDPEYYTEGINYVFSADGSESPNGNIESYEWDFNDGSANADTKTTSHIFTAAGTYRIVLTAKDEEGKEGEIEKTITVGAPKGKPKVVIATEPALEGGLSLEGGAPFTVIFDGSQTTDSDDNIVDYAWDFDGDGIDDEFGATATHTYTEEGTYSAKLTVSDADENFSTAVRAIKVLPEGVVAVVEADTVEGTLPLTVAFDASGSTYDEGQITSFKWNFGDESDEVFGESSITHKYTQIGTFTASVEVIGADNTSAIAETIVTVREIQLSACFNSVFEEGPAPLQTTFDPGCSKGSISKYQWEFGDGGISTEVKPNHTFEEAGEYTVHLEISDSDNNVDSAEVEISVTE